MDRSILEKAPAGGIDKRQKNVSLTGDALRLLYLLARKKGISEAAYLELLVRQQAETENVTLSGF